MERNESRDARALRTLQMGGIVFSMAVIIFQALWHYADVEQTAKTATQTIAQLQATVVELSKENTAKTTELAVIRLRLDQMSQDVQEIKHELLGTARYDRKAGLR
jgi:phage shock protein A